MRCTREHDDIEWRQGDNTTKVSMLHRTYTTSYLRFTHIFCLFSSMHPSTSDQLHVDALTAENRSVFDLKFRAIGQRIDRLMCACVCVCVCVCVCPLCTDLCMLPVSVSVVSCALFSCLSLTHTHAHLDRHLYRCVWHLDMDILLDTDTCDAEWLCRDDVIRVGGVGLEQDVTGA